MKKPIKIGKAITLLTVFSLFLPAAFSISAVVRQEVPEQRTPACLSHWVFDRTVILSQMTANASGLTWDPESNSLVAIVNQPPEIHFLTSEGQFIRKIKLKNFSDTEEICYLFGGFFAIVNERRMNIVLAEINPDTRILDAEELPQIRIAEEIKGNKGIEGLAYDAHARTFYATKEKSPKRIYRIRMIAWPEPFEKNGKMEYEVAPAWDLPFFEYGLKDFSGIHFDPVSRHFLILSDESRSIVEVDQNGNFLGSLSLENVTRPSVPQPEGICLLPRRGLYIISEPNLLYIFNNAIPFEAVLSKRDEI